MKYIILGIIQGLTEFLPVSSSGHLVIFQSLLQVPFSLAFDTTVHLATALALIIYFWKDIVNLLNFRNDKANRTLLMVLLVATIVTGIIGISFKDYFESLFSSVSAVGFFLIVTGIVIIIGEQLGKGQRKLLELNFWDALWLGLAQGCAIAPGLSRSGTTISAGLGRNLDRSLAARISFLLAVPTILGAALLQTKSILKAGTIGLGFWPLALGFIAAFISGLITINFFMAWIRRTTIRYFAYYCFLVGILVLIFSRV
jgi:undecaprenyl-diphosphatase